MLSQKYYKTIIVVGILILRFIFEIQLIAQIRINSKKPFSYTKEMRFDRITVEDGLSQLRVKEIIQDENGILWFGTYNGLNSYNGYTFTNYFYFDKDTNTISHNNIQSIIEDSHGQLWIGTYHGLNKYDKDKNKFKRYFFNKNDPSTNNINTILEDYNSNLWIASQNTIILYSRSDDSFKAIFESTRIGNIIKNDMIEKIFIDNINRLWIFEKKGVIIIDLTEFYESKSDGKPFIKFSSRYIVYENRHTYPLGKYQISKVIQDKNNNVWISTAGGGIGIMNYINIQNIMNIDIRNLFSERLFSKNYSDIGRYESDINSLCFDELGNVLIGTNGSGLGIYNIEKHKIVYLKNLPDDKYSISSNFISTIFKDNLGNLWVSTLFNGLNKYNPDENLFRLFNNHRDKVNLPNADMIKTIFRDEDENIWLGTTNGLMNFDRNKATFRNIIGDKKIPKSLSSQLIFSIYKEKSDLVWIGTFGNGLIRYNIKNGDVKRYLNIPGDPNSISNNSIMALIFDNDGLLWIGTYGKGIDRYDPKTKKFTHFEHKDYDSNTISNDKISTFMKDKIGNIWIGSENGITKYDIRMKTFFNFKNKENDVFNFGSNTISCFYVDKKGRFWVGTYGGGLNRLTEYRASDDSLDFSSTRFNLVKHKTGDDHFDNDVIYGILEDEQSNLWISSNHGIYRYNIFTNRLTNYTMNDGLQGTEFNKGACCRMQDGEMFFGGYNGLNSFYPSEINREKDPPKIILTSFKVFDKNMELSKNVNDIDYIELSYHDNFISFEFATLNYSHPGNNNYSYLLEGYDKNWININNNRSAIYTKLDPGEYLFRFKSYNSSFSWLSEGKALKIIINPPFWKTWYAYIIYIISGIGVLFIYIKSRLRRINSKIEQIQQNSRLMIEMQEEERRRISRELHDGVNQLLMVTKTKFNSFIISCEKAFQKVSGFAETKNESYILSEAIKESDKINQLLEKSIEEIRRFSQNLHPIMLDDLGLKGALSYLIREIRERTGINIEMDAEDFPRNLPALTKINLYRVIQEALNNVEKHSNAGNVKIILSQNDFSLDIQILDDGKGFNLSDSKKSKDHLSYGLRNMKDRINLIHGSFLIQSGISIGTKIKINIPMK